MLAEPLRFIHCGYGVTVCWVGPHWEGRVYLDGAEVSDFIFEFVPGKYPGWFAATGDVPDREELIRAVWMRVWLLTKGENPHCPTIEASTGGLHFTFTRWRLGLPWVSRTADGKSVRYYHSPNPLGGVVEAKSLVESSRKVLALKLNELVKAFDC
jgi:hypothetical protein